MSKLFYKVIIEDIENEQCSDEEINILLDLFETTLKRLATTLARKAEFDLNDYATARKSTVNHFTLILERKTIKNSEQCFEQSFDQWFGIFRNKNKSLSLIATLEKN